MLLRLGLAIVSGVIAFIVSVWLLGVVAPTFVYNHLLAVLIGVAVGIGVYRGNWTAGPLV